MIRLPTGSGGNRGRETKADRLGDMRFGDGVGPVEIGNRAGHPDDPVIPARGKVKAFGYLVQQRPCFAVRGGDFFQQIGFHR